MEKHIGINVLGSCVSRVSLLDGNQKGHDIADDELYLDYFLDKQNLVLAMMPSPFTREEIDSVKREELWDKSRIYTVHQSLGKETVPLLLNSKADYLVMDLFDFQNYFAILGKTCFDTNAYEFMNTGLFRQYQKDIEISCFDMLPEWLWYPYVDLFFEKIMTKYDSNHIILNRFRANTWYLGKDGKINKIPDEFKNPYQANDKFNGLVHRLEDYIIGKINPYVIDISKYYMGNQNDWNNLQGAHFETAFYHHTLDIVRKIIKEGPEKRVYDSPRFFDKRYEENYPLDIQDALDHMVGFVDTEEILWMNLLDKLNARIPEEPLIQEYVKACRGV